MKCSTPLLRDRAAVRRSHLVALLFPLLVVSAVSAPWELIPSTAGGDRGTAPAPPAQTATLPLPVSAPEMNASDSVRPAADAAEEAETGGKPAEMKSPRKVVSGRPALLFNLLLLEKGAERVARRDGYTALFTRQEALAGEMQDRETMRLKLRHRPFSVYLKWLVGDKGREVLYVEGQNDGEMMVKLGGFKGRLLPALNVDPHGSTAMKESRHPITNIGLVNLAEKIIAHRKRDLESEHPVRCRMIDGVEVGDRSCYCFVVRYDSPEASPVYRKSIQYVDKKLMLPIGIRNYTWPARSATEDDPKKLDERTLIEYYQYSDIQWETSLTAADFDPKNSEYAFR